MKQALNAVSPPIESTIQSASIVLSSGVATDDDFHATTSDLLREIIRVVTSVANQGSPLSVSEEFVDGGNVVAIPRRQRYVERAPPKVGDDVDLRRETSSTTTQTVCLDPPFPPAAS
jgi:hypothetical protein